MHMLMAVGFMGFLLAAPDTARPDAETPIFRAYGELTWNRIVPALGSASPEVSILHVDPKTQATQLIIRTRRPIHVRKHWHSANETHTLIRGTAILACDGKRVTLGPGSFNYMPAKMVHEAWLPADSLTFITVDGAWDINWVDGPPTAKDVGRPRPSSRR
jgi:mannose-6-phosphate isomerase-like protein (cupin superfamily)